MFKKINFSQIVRKNRVAVLIASVLSFVIGLLCIIAPFAAGGILIWVVVGITGILAIVSIAKFISPGVGNKREPTALVLGIIILLCVVGIIAGAYLAPDIKFKDGTILPGFTLATTRMLVFAELFFAIMSIFNNIFLLCNIGNFESSEKGWAIAKGIFGLLIGILMLIFPAIMFIVGVVMGGVYLCVMGVGVFILVIKIWHVGDKNNDDNNNPNDVIENKEGE